MYTERQTVLYIMTSLSVITAYGHRETDGVVHYDVILCDYVMCTQRDRER